MTTPTAQPASQIITDALLQLIVIREGESPSPEQQAQGIRALNQMMAIWEADGRNLGYIPVGTVTDILTVPDAALMGITASLSVMLAPNYGATVSPELIAKVQIGSNIIDKITAKEVIPDLDLPRPAYLPPTFSITSGQ